MPTAAKLVAAICYAALGWFCADLIKPHLPEGTQVGLFSPISAALGVIVGWTFVGRRLGDGTGKPLGIGFSGAVLLAVYVLFAFSGYEMVRLSTRGRYDGPVDALQSMFELGVGYAWTVAVPEVLAAVVLGGLLCGVLTGYAARKWE